MADVVSRNPSISTVSLISIIRQPASIKDLNSLITLQEIQDAYKSDQSYQELAKTTGCLKKRYTKLIKCNLKLITLIHNM